jgi:hypothetical protein
LPIRAESAAGPGNDHPRFPPPWRADREWIKVKNRAHPAFERAMLIALSKRAGSRSR